VCITSGETLRRAHPGDLSHPATPRHGLTGLRLELVEQGQRPDRGQVAQVERQDLGEQPRRDLIGPVSSRPWLHAVAFLRPALPHTKPALAARRRVSVTDCPTRRCKTIIDRASRPRELLILVTSGHRLTSIPASSSSKPLNILVIPPGAPVINILTGLYPNLRNTPVIPARLRALNSLTGTQAHGSVTGLCPNLSNNRLNPARLRSLSSLTGRCPNLPNNPVIPSGRRRPIQATTRREGSHATLLRRERSLATSG